MVKQATPTAKLWQSLQHGDREFLKCDLHVRDDRIVPFSVGRTIADRYDVRDVLARGGGGVILIATDRHTENPVLVKALAEYELKRSDLNHPVENIIESLRRSRHHLQTERRILVQLRNSGCNAVPHPIDYVYDVNLSLQGPHRTDAGEEWDFDDAALMTSEPYLVMQRVHGVSLKEALETFYPGGLEQAVALRIIDQAAGVIEKLQTPLRLANGQTWEMVYQDVKPGNIIVDEYGHATVLDFGGCQLVIEDTLVLQGSYSPGHCAPECGHWGQAISPAADTYGLGATLFHMLSGKDPRKLLPKNRPPDSPKAVHIDAEQLADRCSLEIVSLIAKCIDWDIDRRFQSAAEFRSALSPLLTAS